MKFKPIKALKPKNLDEFIGKEMIMMGGEKVKIETIVGCMFKPTRFEVNGKYNIVILSAYKQLNKDKSITQKNIDDFDKCQVEEIVKMPTSLDAPKTPKFGEH